MGRQAATKRKPSKCVYLMRGVPASGKSFRAKQIAGKNGVVCEVDLYFRPPGKDYSFVLAHRTRARAVNMIHFLGCLENGTTPIIVDRGNNGGDRTKWYISTALLFGYAVKFAEPTSWWWKSIKTRLTQQWPSTKALWADSEYLAKIQKTTHRVSRGTIMSSLMKYEPDLTIRDIMED